MNFNICKKCFELNDNNIHFMYVMPTDNNLNLGILRIKGLFKSADKNLETLKIKGLFKSDFDNEKAPFFCIQQINIKKINPIFLNSYIMEENKQKELLNEIEEPSKTCKFYCEHIMENINK